MASITSIVYQPKDQPYPDPMGDYLRLPVGEADLVTGVGIHGDAKGGHHPARQLNLLSQEWLDEMKPKGYKTLPGQFGEQIIVSGLDLHALEAGTKIRLGDTAIIEITKARTGCERLEAAQEKPITTIADKVGMLAAVLSDGKIRVGDRVALIE